MRTFLSNGGERTKLIDTPHYHAHNHRLCVIMAARAEWCLCVFTQQWVYVVKKNYIIRCWIDVLHQIYEATISLVEVFILGKLTHFATVGEYGW